MKLATLRNKEGLYLHLCGPDQSFAVDWRPFGEATKLPENEVQETEEFTKIWIGACGMCGVRFPAESINTAWCRHCDPDIKLDDTELTVDEWVGRIRESGVWLDINTPNCLDYHGQVHSIETLKDADDNKNIFAIHDGTPYYDGGPNLLLISTNVEAIARKIHELVNLPEKKRG